ncbi:YbaN family protein [Salinisphaera sp. LB1]|uniref:YbaN family protein n=1 Tax=Salinisphaera sp. LB1 TaxID=2183911 RepID=UPI000D70689F|nr:YbaN family protein [Salinisphaera sp. LB1]
MAGSGVIRSRILRWLLRALAFACIGLGALGVVLPGLPTTPFVLVAAWAAGKSSPELRRRLRSHPHFGPALVAWEDERAIPRRAKWLAVALMAASWIVLWCTIEHRGMIALVGAMLAAMAVFVFTRPEPSVGRAKD